MTAEIYKTLGPLEKLVTFMSMNPIAWLNMQMTPSNINAPSPYATGQTSPNAVKKGPGPLPIAGVVVEVGKLLPIQWPLAVIIW